MEDNQTQDSEVQRVMDERLSSAWKFLFSLQKNRYFNIIMDGMRILLFIALIIIIYILIKEIEVVKILGSDVCSICMNKTGCNCFCAIP